MNELITRINSGLADGTLIEIQAEGNTVRLFYSDGSQSVVPISGVLECGEF